MAKCPNMILHFDVGPALRDIYHASGSKLGFFEWEADMKMRLGDHVHGDMLLKKIRALASSNDTAKILIISGTRGIDQIHHFAQELGIKKPSIIFIDAPVALRKANFEKREGIKLSDAKFNALTEEDNERGLDAVKKYATILTNATNNDISDEFLKIILQ